MPELRSTRIAFGEALFELAEMGLDVVAVSADTSSSMGIDILKAKYPERCFDAGVAEQNMMMIAAGLAATGKIAFAASYSVFTSMRALEQLRTFVCYPNLNVKIGAGLGGFSGGIEGITHMALEDLGIVRCVPNLVVLTPADYFSTKKIVHEVAKIQSPCYIRLGRDPSPVIFDDKYSFSIGRANTVINNGSDVGIITGGIVLSEVLSAAESLHQKGVGMKVVEVPTLKPIDKEAIIELAKSTDRLVTIEEHNVIGGLYSAVCEVLCSSLPTRVYPLAVPDIFTESGKPSELMARYNLNMQGISEYILGLLHDQE